MKLLKSFFCALILALLLSMCSCGASWQLDDPYYIEESDVEIEVDNIGATIENPPISRTYARLCFTNDSGCDIELDLNYIIKLEGKSGWIDLEEFAERQALKPVIVKSGEEYKMTIDWYDIYGTLKEGTYRIIFYYHKEGTQYITGCNFGFFK